MINSVVRAHELSKNFRVFKMEKTFINLFNRIYQERCLYSQLAVLTGLSFEIARSQKVALIGTNGAGKTTLLRLIAGIYNPSSGSLHISGNPSAFFRFWIGATKELTVIQTIKLLAAIYRIEPTEIKSKLENIVCMADLKYFLYTPVKILSSGQYQRLALSVFFHVKSDFVIFDEALTYIDAHFLHKCEKYFEDLSQSSKTVILTSHDNSFLRKYCTTAIWLDNGSIRMQGEIEEVLSAYEAEQ